MSVLALSAGDAYVSVKPDAQSFGRQLLAQIAPQLNAVGRQASTALTKAGGGLTTVQKAAIAGYAALGVAAAKFAASSIQAYREHEVAINRLNVAIQDSPKLIGETTKAFEQQANALQDVTGFQDEEVLSADAVLARFQLTGDQIRETVPLVLDYARATGVDATTAAGNLGRALLGNTRGLKTLGIEFKATGDRSRDLAEIQRLLAERVKGTAEAFGKTSAGQLAIFQAKVDDLQEALGSILVPILNVTVGALSDVVGVLTPLVPAVVALGGAFLAYKAIAFVPVLLESIAAGLEAIGLASVAAGVSASATAVTGLGVALLGLSRFAGPAAIAYAAFGESTNPQQAEYVALHQQQVQALSRSLALLPPGSDQARLAAGKLAAEYFGKVNPTFADAENALREYNREFRTSPASVAALTVKLRDLARAQFAANVATEATQVSTQAARDAFYEAANAALAEKAATEQLAGGLLGVQGAALGVKAAHQQLAQAQQQVTKDIKDGKKGTAEYRQDLLALEQAQLGSAQSQLSFQESVSSYAETLLGPVHDAQAQVAKDQRDIAAGGKDAAAAQQRLAGDVRALHAAQTALAPEQAKAIDLIRTLGRQAGLSKDVVNGLIDKVLGYTGAVKGVPSAKQTRFTTPGLAAADALAKDLKNTLNDVPNSITVNVYEHLHKLAGGATGGAFPGGASGGAFTPRFASGTAFLGPTGPFIAGEASYPTPLGTGGELASNAGVFPLNADMIERLGGAIDRAGGSTRSPDEIGAAVARHLWAMMRGSGTREVRLVAKGRDLVAVLDSAELWAR